MTVRYNVFFNGKNKYNDGIKQLNNTNKDDFSRIIPLYAVSNHEAAKGIESEMDITIEKCRKAIKNHSIKKKPTKKRKKMRDADYKAWLQQEEFNPMINRAWLLLGKAEFHKADFMGAVGTMTYIQKHFSTEPLPYNEATIWKARAYAELGWMFEAESTIDKIKEKNLHYSLISPYHAAMADIKIKQQQYADAIPHLELALPNEHDKIQRTRFNYVLGQLYAITGERKKAVEHFQNAAKRAQNYEMEFNATLEALKTEPKAQSAIRGLEKMAKSANNKEYLDQIYLAEGQQYLQLKKEDKAIEMMKKAIESSTRNGIEKAVAAQTLADLYYNKHRYIEAEPYYRLAESLMTNTADNYFTIRERKETLGELVTHYETQQLQDSLLILSKKSPEEQRKIVNQIIEERKKADAAAAKAAADSAAMAIANANTPQTNRPTMQQRGNGEWYFYNTQLIASGANEFRRQWGNRALEDNWRVAKIAGGSSDQIGDTSYNDKNTNNGKNADPNDTTNNNLYDPEYYLAQIPKNNEERAAASELVANALLNMGLIYEDKIKDDSIAAATFRQLRQRFNTLPRLLDIYYTSYCIYGRLDSLTAQEEMRQHILKEFPNSRYAAMLSQPDYAERATRMYSMQDSIYQATYRAYMTGHYDSVKTNFQWVEREYPTSQLIPQFTLLNALSIAREGKEEEFRIALNNMVQKYPKDHVSDFGRDLLAHIGQGKSAATDGTPVSPTMSSTPTNTNQPGNTTPTTVTFTNDPHSPHVLALVIVKEKAIDVNQLLYDVAAFNFTHFMVKDFDLRTQKLENYEAVVVTGLMHNDEAQWYRSMIMSEPTLANMVNNGTYRIVTISEENLHKIGYPLTIDDYEEFIRKQ
ncbi:MAG: hypothetical protein Q4D14_03595 [Bacteroidales bacterium]|nr:hypothetical protein [Bacteroidales bacterium]